MKINIYSTKNVLRGIGLAAVMAIFGSSAQAQLLTQAFTTSSAPSGWTLSNTCSSSSSNANWKFSTSGMGYGASGATDHTMGGGTYFAWVDGSSPYPCMCSMTTSNISATLGAGLELSFWIYSNNTNDPGNNTLTVDYYDGATWHNSVYSFAGNNPGWFQAVVGLGANPVAGTGNVKLRFNVNKNSAYTSFYNDIAIDDVSLIELLPCSNPPAGGTITASTTSACTAETINFALNGVTNAQGLTRQWQDSTASGSWQDITGATSAIYSTTISQPTYFRCKSVCSGGTPAYSDTILINQAPFYTCYCSAGATSTTYGYIGDFEFSNVSYTSPVGCGQQYTDNTAMVANVFQGNTYNLSAYVNSCTGTTAYNTGFKVWIDYNQNGVYTDPGEEVIAQNLTYFQTHGGNITIPATSLTGNTGMRVMVVESGTLSAMTPCYSYTWGEVEDYTINIQLPPADDAGVAAIISPVLPYCGGDSAVQVIIQNLGTDTLFSADINFEVNGGTTNTYSWTGMILPLTNDTNILNIGNNPGGSFAAGDNLVVYTSNPNGVADIYNLNDTLSVLDINAGLAGTYTIPGNYATINDAINALNAYGVCDDVIFDISAGTYAEHMELTEVIGANENATITFQSASGDTADVLVQFEGNFDTTSVVMLDGADWFRFKNITFENTSTSYGYVFRFENGADHNIIDSNRIVTTVSTTTSTNRAAIYSSGGLDNYNTISNNSIENGSYGIYVRGVSNTNTGLEVGLDVNNNHIMNPYYMGAYFYYHQGLNFSENEVSSATTYSTGYGIYFGYCKNGLTIDYNHVHPESNTGNWPYYGMYTIYCEGSAQGFEYVRNNIINAGVGAYVGFYQYYSDLMYVANNTFTVLGGTSTTSRAYYAYYSDFYFTNNNLCTNFGAGQAAGYYYGTPFSVDNNNYYALGANAFYYNGQYLTDLPAFQNAANLDPMSLSLNPNFADTLAGILCNDSLDGTGVPLAYVTDDFEHITRNASTPDIGAREFVSLANFTLSGDTICGDMYEVFGPVNNATWSVDGNQSTGISVTLNTSNTPQTFNVGISFSSICNVDTATGLPIPVTASGDFRLVPAAELASSLHLCADDQATLNPGGGANATYVWFPTNETSATININAGGVYSVTKMEEGCESSATTVVTQSDGVTLLDAEACAEDLPYNVDATIVGGVSYAWSSGETTASVALNTTGVYTVTTTDEQGCSSTDSMMFEAIDVPVAAIDEVHTGGYFFFSSANSQNQGSNATYVWDFGDGSSPSTDANPEHQFPWTNPSAPTTFTVTLTITNDCGTNTTQMQVTPNVTGIDDVYNSNHYSVYPNPTSGIFNIEFDNSTNENVNVSVLDISGRLIHTQHANSSDIINVDMNNVSAGTYILQIDMNGTISNSRIIIK